MQFIQILLSVVSQINIYYFINNTLMPFKGLPDMRQTKIFAKPSGNRLQWPDEKKVKLMKYEEVILFLQNIRFFYNNKYQLKM